jgi:Cu2+-exporting ATPase
MTTAMRCFHCNDPIVSGAPLYARVAQQMQPVCCLGCQAACEWIGTLGLADYYRLRDAAAPRAQGAVDLHAWDRDELQRLYVHPRADGTAEVCVLVEGLRCAACGWLIEHALSACIGVREVGVNIAGKRVCIVWQPEQAKLSTVLAAVTRLGYTPHPLNRTALDDVAAREQRDALKRLAVAGLGMMQAMMFAIVLYAGALEGIDNPTRDFFRWIGLLVTMPVISYAALPFFRGARRDWVARRPGMDTPVALALLLVFVASAVETLRGGAHVYFDSASMFVFLLLGGRYLEMRARHRAADLVDALARLQPAIAQRRNADGALEGVGVHELRPGDRVVVADGATIPADGTLLSAACSVDEALLSGESRAIRRLRGERMIAGSIVSGGPAEIHVERLGADTMLSAIVRLSEQAQRQRPHWVSHAERTAGYFVIGLLCAAGVTALAWSLVDASRAISATLAVLVVACPCAFALAVPAALARAFGVLARRGVLVLKADALENLARVDHFVFDKTGTLTDRAIELTAIAPLAQRSAAECLTLATQLEACSTHPFAQALRTAAGPSLKAAPANNLRSVAGLGVEGDIDGRHYRLGSATFAVGTHTHADCDDVVLADADGALAAFTFREHLRAQAATTCAQLQAQGAGVEILSGDCAARVAEVAQRLGIGAYAARLTPVRKLEHLHRLRARGRFVGIVGDGVNDAPALAGADLAIALGSGAELAQCNADIVLANDRLDALIETRRVAAMTRRIMRQNLLWALVYNAATVPLAACGWIPPWLAAIGMSLSSLGVVFNSLRINVGGAAREPAPGAHPAPPFGTVPA